MCSDARFEPVLLGTICDDLIENIGLISNLKAWLRAWFWLWTYPCAHLRDTMFVEGMKLFEAASADG